MKSHKFYSPLEEKINVILHIAGLLFSVVALVLLVLRAVQYGGVLEWISAGVFGFSLIALYAASIVYHSAKQQPLRSKLRIIDHASIYVLIAGTYTPFALITLAGPAGWTIFFASWGMAIIGITLKVFFTGKYDVISTLMYIFMGWIIVFEIGPLVNNLSFEGLAWLFAGGFWYTTGAVIYSIKKIQFNHAIFHLFVLAGSFSHFMAVYFYVLPG